MKLVFFSLILNNHQANVADELWKQTGHQYCFVELANLKAEHKKGDTRNYDTCPYLLRAWESGANWQKAMELARTAECCVFSGVQALPFQKERMKLGLLSFDMSERWLKQGIKNILSPAISKMFWAYWLGGWKNKPLYKLCCSAFAAGDHHRLGMYKGKCFKWGYFTALPKVISIGSKERTADLNISCESETYVEASSDVSTSGIAPLMWCSRYLMWKHPELPILLADRLKAKGFRFHLDMYGEGDLRETAERKVKSLRLDDVVVFHNNMPNDILLAEMHEHEIFLFTSDKNEGWGAVANESMSNGCVLVGSDAMGSAPYLIKDGENGFMFKGPNRTCSFENPDMAALDSLCGKVEWLLEYPNERRKMRKNARKIMENVWSPQNAAQSLLRLIEDLKKGKGTSIEEGPCSKA